MEGGVSFGLAFGSWWVEKITKQGYFLSLQVV